MRLFVATALLVSSFSVLACPKLAGSYKTCFSNLTQERLSTGTAITQKIVNKVTRYTFTSEEVEAEKNASEEYIADGKTRSVSETDSDTGIKVKTSTKSSCVGDSLIVNTKATIAGEIFVDLTTKTYLSGNKLIQEFDGISMGDELKEIVTCEN